MPARLSQAKIIAIIMAVCSCGCLIAPAASQNVYGCATSGTSQRRLTNYGKFTFILHPLPPRSSQLQANMDCTITIIGYSSSRWIVTLEIISLEAYQAQLDVYEGGTTSGKNVMSLTSSGTAYRQFGISSGTFTVRQVTKSFPTSGASFGVRMLVEHLDSSDCPSGWYKASSSARYCYGVPKLVGNLTYEESSKACNKMLANLIMGNFDYDSILSELYEAPSSVVNPMVAYWVGMYQTNDELKFLNKYTSLDSVSGRLCSSTSSSCQCIAYQSRRFYRDYCSSRRPYVCYMPRGGTESFYDLDSLISKATSVVTIIAIVLTVGFILAVLASLIAVFVCCIRRNAAARRTRRGNSNARPADGSGGVFVIAGASGVPPPSYPNSAMAQPPPPPLISSPPAPPYTPTAPIYDNVGFESGAAGGVTAPSAGSAAAAAADAVEKPPPYNPEWSRNNVPA